MAALATDFHTWSPVESYNGSIIEYGAAGAATFYRGAIGTQAVTGAITIKISNGVTTDIPIGIVTRRTVATGASSHFIPTYQGVVWFSGVAAIAAATGLALLYATLNSDNPADLTATAAGNTSAFGRIVGVTVTAVSGFVDQRQKAVVAETA